MLKLIIWLCLFIHGSSKPIPDSSTEESYNQSPTNNNVEYSDSMNKENSPLLSHRDNNAESKRDNSTNCGYCGDCCERERCFQAAPHSTSSNTPCECTSSNIRGCESNKHCNSTADEDTLCNSPCNTRCKNITGNGNVGEDTPDDVDDDDDDETPSDENCNAHPDDDCDVSPDEDCNISPDEDTPCTSDTSEREPCDENVICTKDCNPTCFHQHQHDHYHHEEPQTVTCLHQHHHHHHHHHQHHHFHYQPYCCRCNETRNNGNNNNKDYICCSPQPPVCCSNNKDVAGCCANNVQTEKTNQASGNDFGNQVNNNYNSMNIVNGSTNDDDVKQKEFTNNNESLKDALPKNNAFDQTVFSDTHAIGDTKTLVSNISQLVDSNTNSDTNKNNLSKIIFTSVARICQFLHNNSNAYKVVHDKRCCICCCKQARDKKQTINNDSKSKRSEDSDPITKHHCSCRCCHRCHCCKTHHCHHHSYHHHHHHHHRCHHHHRHRHHHHHHHHCCACCNKYSGSNSSGNSNG